MRGSAVLLGSILSLAAADAAVMAAVGTHMGGGPHQTARIVVCGVGAYLLARRSDRPGNAARAAATAAGANLIAVLITTTAHVASGQATANGVGPGYVIAFVIVSTGVGLASGIAGAGAGWLAHRLWPPKEIMEARASAGRRRKFP